jgi:ATP-binding cassette subfamily F protein 3
MTLISASNLAKSYGEDDIFSAISLSIPPQSRIALVGPNGIGKTTLLRVLIGLEEPSDGTIRRARRLEIGYLPQEALLSGTHTLWEECLKALSDLLAMETELVRLEGEMSNPQKADEALARYGPLQETFERLGGYTYETRIRQTLTGLGFDSRDYHRSTQQLSGGQRTRAVLARLLLSDPDLLILDEPTNHLDITAVEWLEGYLSQWAGAVLIVSHDRYFLDKVVDHVWEMSTSGLEVYRGSYSDYVGQRQERWELRQKLFNTEKERLLKELDYVKRNISGQRTQQAKGKLRRLSRQVQAIEKLGVEALQGASWGEISEKIMLSPHPMRVDEVERRIKGLRGPKNRPFNLHLKIKSHRRSGDLVLRTYDVDIGYQDDDTPLFHVPDLVLRRGECAALIGPNGAGKTTFLKTILAKMPPLSGEVVLGASLNVAYFAQAHEDLNPENTLIAEIESVAPQLLLANIRDHLALYLFSGDEVFKEVSTLSGGERGRLALAKLSLTKANLLLLDEPTNHLDIPSQEILQEVLSNYQGTILLVSHDRYLIDALATQIWEIETGQANLRVFQGTYSQYRLHMEAELVVLEEARSQAVSVAQKTRRDRTSTEERLRQARLSEIEIRVASLEKELADLERQLEIPPPEAEQVQKMGEDYVRLQQEINSLLTEWEELHN